MSQVGLTMRSDTQSTGRPPGRKKSGVAVVISLLVVAGLVAVAGFFAYDSFLKPAPDYTGTGNGVSVLVVVNKGDSIPEIGQTLERQGVVQSTKAFITAASGDERARSIQPGTYRMQRQMSAKAALEALTNANNRTGVASIPEGSRAARVIEIAANATGIPVAEFEAVLKNPKGIGLPAYANNHVEGFLFPSTYNFPPDATATSVLAAMVTKFKQVAADIDLEDRAAELGQTPHDIVTIASIVQAEGLPADYAKVSRVIYNRLACTLPTCKSEYIQGRLQMDSTLNYAQGTNDSNLSADELSKDGPYNTHKTKGLPPTAIDNPGAEALAAALDPASGSWLYFVSTPDFTQFSDTFAQQQEAERKWRSKG